MADLTTEQKLKLNLAIKQRFLFQKQQKMYYVMTSSAKLLAKFKKFSNKLEGELICLTNKLCPMVNCFFFTHQISQIN